MKSPVSVNTALTLRRQAEQLRVSQTALHDAFHAINRIKKVGLDFMEVLKSETYQ